MFQRHESNPILTIRDLPMPADSVFNPGVAEVDGETLLLLRVEDRRGFSSLYAARSENGVDGWRIEPKPLLAPGQMRWPHDYEEYGCEDARITPLPGPEWVICYTAYSRFGPAVAMARTRDFRSVERVGVILPPNNKDAVVLPERVGDLWVLLHRPVTGGQEHIWHAISEDLVHWSRPGMLMEERGGPWWDGLRVGVGAMPIPTPEGWLLIYHGVKEVATHPIYRLGLALLRRSEPRHVIARCDEWVFGPEAPYELEGDAPNVVFTCGALVRDGVVWMYYGAADTRVCLATAELSDLLDAVRPCMRDEAATPGLGSTGPSQGRKGGKQGGAPAA